MPEHRHRCEDCNAAWLCEIEHEKLASLFMSTCYPCSVKRQKNGVPTKFRKPEWGMPRKQQHRLAERQSDVQCAMFHVTATGKVLNLIDPKVHK